MNLRRSILVLSFFGISLKAYCGIGVCRFYSEIPEPEIREKIRNGIPFELMSALFEEGELIQKKTIRVSYNLWDEIVTVKNGESVIATFPLVDSQKQLCKYLDFNDFNILGKRLVYRLLLNPLWAERITRLQISTGKELNSKRVIGIDWKSLSKEMPSDKVLFEREIP